MSIIHPIFGTNLVHELGFGWDLLKNQNTHTFQSSAEIMVRTNPATAGRLHAYYNMPNENRQARRGTTNPNYQARLNAFQHRKILPERGMKLNEIPDHRTVEIAMERGWLNYVRQPKPYDAELVR